MPCGIASSVGNLSPSFLLVSRNGDEAETLLGTLPFMRPAHVVMDEPSGEPNAHAKHLLSIYGLQPSPIPPLQEEEILTLYVGPKKLTLQVGQSLREAASSFCARDYGKGANAHGNCVQSILRLLLRGHGDTWDHLYPRLTPMSGVWSHSLLRETAPSCALEVLTRTSSALFLLEAAPQYGSVPGETGAVCQYLR